VLDLKPGQSDYIHLEFLPLKTSLTADRVSAAADGYLFIHDDEGRQEECLRIKMVFV
jgi:hypothetical protein